MELLSAHLLKLTFTVFKGGDQSRDPNKKESAERRGAESEPLRERAPRIKKKERWFWKDHSREKEKRSL